MQGLLRRPLRGADGLHSSVRELFYIWFGFRVSGFGFRVWGLGFRVWGLGFGAQGLGFMVLGWDVPPYTNNP